VVGYFYDQKADASAGCVRAAGVPKETLLRAMQHSSIANRFSGNKIYNPTQLLIL
jgi:hypothetical protein